MAYKCSFMDNGVYEAQDVNDMFSHLTSAGVVFSDTGNTLSDLNEANANTVSEGVTNYADSCRVINQDGVYKICAGTCFMEDGSAITFDEEGAELEVTPYVYSYVYLQRSIPENDIKIVVSENAPAEGCVSLAEIDTTGAIYDRRTYSKAKVQVGTPNTLKNFTQRFTPADLGNTLSIDIGTGDFSYFIVWNVNRIDGDYVTSYVTINKNLVPVTEGATGYIDTGNTMNSSPDLTIYVSKDGQTLNMSLARYNRFVSYDIEFGVI